MSLRLRIEFFGVEGVIDHLRQTIPEAVHGAMEESMNQVAKDGRDRAKELVAVDTGSLQKSIRVERHAWPAKNIIYTGIRAGGYVVNPKTGRIVDYARHIEYGTSTGRPRPYLRPALRWAGKKFKPYFWEALSKRLK